MLWKGMVMPQHLKTRLILLFACLIGMWVTLPPARTAWHYRNRGPDNISLEHLLNKDVSPGAWVTVSGIEWTRGTFTLSHITRDTYGTTQTRDEYHLLVSPDDPGLSFFMTMTRTLQSLDTQARTCPPEKRAAVLAAYEQLLHEGLDQMDTVRPFQGIPLAQSLSNSPEPEDTSFVYSRGNAVRGIMRMASAATGEERERMSFEEQARSLQQQITKLLQHGTPMTVTGLVSVPPEEVVSQYQQQSHFRPDVQIQTGSEPLPAMMSVFVIACCGFFATLLWKVKGKWFWRK